MFISINYFTDKAYMATRNPNQMPSPIPLLHPLRVESDVHSPATLALTRELTVLKNKRRSNLMPKRLDVQSGGEK